ncbi:MAG: outer membrane protein assembly factor BamE [Deltaproteobacteria bacterium]|nr:outer membrane protein assembly factor BamE [Deltaproteobacteria bacterium]
MRFRILVVVLAMMILLGGCKLVRKKEYRYEKIAYKHPKWDETTLRKVAARHVEIGMTEEMVLAALGEPEFITREGDRVRWEYAKYEQFNESVRKIPVYFIYLKGGFVVNIGGNRDDLDYLQWYK